MNRGRYNVSTQALESLRQIIGQQLAIGRRVPLDKHYFVNQVSNVPFQSRIKTLGKIRHIVVVATDDHCGNRRTRAVTMNPQSQKVGETLSGKRGSRLQLSGAIKRAANP